MSIYSEMQTVAAGILAEFDQGGIHYVHTTPGNGPPDNPGEPIETPYKMDGAARGVSFRYVGNGSNVVASDLQATLAVLPGVVPDISGFVTLDGTRYKIVQIMNIPPVGPTIAHRLIFRK